MLKILVNCFDMPLAEEGSAGAGKYVQGLLPQLAKKSELYVICSKHNAKEYQFRGIKKVFKINGFDEIDIENISKKMDVYFNPTNKLTPINLPIDIPVVMVVHDLQHNHYPHYFQKGMFEERNKEYGFALARSDGLVSISNWEKSNFEKYFNIRQVKTIYHAPYLFEKFRNTGAPNKNINKLTDFPNYYIYPAVPWVHKNHYRLIEAFAILNHKYKIRDFNLILTGAKHTVSASLFQKKIKELNADDFIQQLGYIQDDELYSLIANAKGMIFPSIYEGFGIPIIDAMNIGTPVLTTNLTSMPEITHNAVDYFKNPFDSYQMASDIENFDIKINNKQYDIEYAKKIGSQYSSVRQVLEYLEYFETVIKSKHIRNIEYGSYSTKNISSNTSPHKITIILDLEIPNSNENINDIVEKFLNDARPEIYDYVVMLPYELRDRIQGNELDEILKITTASYYKDKIHVSKANALEHILESVIKTDYFICLDMRQFLNLDYMFIKKSISLLDYFQDIFSCYRSKSKFNQLLIKRPPSDERISIQEFNTATQNTDEILTRFYNRVIRTKTCRFDGMIGSLSILSKDITVNSNIVL